MNDNCDMIDICEKYGFCFDNCYDEELRKDIKGYMGLSIYPPQGDGRCCQFEKKQIQILDAIFMKLKP